MMCVQKHKKLIHKYLIFNISFSLLQHLNDRSPYSEEVVISSCLKKDKKNIMQSTKLILGISNWHFNRDTQHLVEGPKCKLEDINISFKLASTAFNAADEASSLGKPAASKDQQQLKYDRNGVTVPYAAFCSLMEQPLFFEYLDKVQRQYEIVEGAINKDINFADDDDDDNSGKQGSSSSSSNNKERPENEEEEIGSKKNKRKNVLTDSENEEDDETVAEVPSEDQSHTQHQQSNSLLKTTSSTSRRGRKKGSFSTPPPPPPPSSSTPSTP